MGGLCGCRRLACLQQPSARLSSLALMTSKTPAQTCPPPSASPPLPQLLGYIKKDKQGDSLVEKLCQRIAGTDDPAQWHSIAFCLTQARARLWAGAEAARLCCCARRQRSATALHSLAHAHKPSPLPPSPPTQLPLSDKGLRKLSESFRLYKHALHDEEVAGAVGGIVAKAKKGSHKAELKVSRCFSGELGGGRGVHARGGYRQHSLPAD